MIPKKNVLNDRDLLRSLKTREELTFIVNCSGDKYRFISIGLKVFEGGEHLLKKEEKCSLVSRLINCFDNMFPSADSAEDIIKIC